MILFLPKRPFIPDPVRSALAGRGISHPIWSLSDKCTARITSVFLKSHDRAPCPLYNMSKIGLVVLLSFFSGRALSQDYFVFIGSDNRQPFYVRIDSQLYSSSPEGHLLLAPLKDSDYTMTIGF